MRAFTHQWAPQAHAVLDLGSEQVVRSLEFPLRHRYADLGRRFEIEISPNGQDWTSVWNEWTGGIAVAGALEDQLVVPIRFVLPDITARYLRIHPTPDWMVRELRVLGP